MAAKRLTKEEKRLAALAEQTEKQKKALVAQLRKTPIVQVACERTHVGRSTYYEWRARDKIFARAADRALDHGRFFVNDLAESKLIALIQNSSLPAISLWLRHNHPKYTTFNRVIHEHQVAVVRPSVEEEAVALNSVAQVAAERMSATALKINGGTIERVTREKIAGLDKQDVEIEKLREYEDNA